MRLNIKWSKHKQIIESKICESLKKRIKIHLTHYRAVDEPESKFWITFDGKEIFSASKMKWLNEWDEIKKEYSKRHDAENPFDYAEKVMHYNGKYNVDDIQDSLQQYINMPIEEALVSKDFIIKAFAMIDKRTGKRRLSSIALDTSEHQLVRKLYQIRCDIEGIDKSSESATKHNIETV